MASTINQWTNGIHEQQQRRQVYIYERVNDNGNIENSESQLGWMKTMWISGLVKLNDSSWNYRNVLTLLKSVKVRRSWCKLRKIITGVGCDESDPMPLVKIYVINGKLWNVAKSLGSVKQMKSVDISRISINHTNRWK